MTIRASNKEELRLLSPIFSMPIDEGSEKAIKDKAKKFISDQSRDTSEQSSRVQTAAEHIGAKATSAVVSPEENLHGLTGSLASAEIDPDSII